MSFAGRPSRPAAVSFFGKTINLVGKREDEIVALGIGRKFQAPSIYGNLTVWENLDLSLKRSSKGVLPNAVREIDGGGARKGSRRTLKRSA